MSPWSWSCPPPGPTAEPTATPTTTLDLYGHLYPGEIYRYADRLNEAAGMTDVAEDAAKMRPDDGEDDQDGE